MYDVEQFLREAGAEKINERAVISLERELKDTVEQIVYEASIYANYAGRRKLIQISDVKLAERTKRKAGRILYRNNPATHQRGKRIAKSGKFKVEQAKIMIVNNEPVVTELQIV